MSKQFSFIDDNGKTYSEKVEKKLGDLVSIRKGTQLNKSLLSPVKTKNTPYPVYNGGISPSGYYSEFNRSSPSIIMSEGGNSCGFTTYLKNDYWSGGHAYELLPVDSQNLDKLYLFQLLKYKENEIMALRIGTGLPNIQKAHLSAFSVTYTPKIEEQRKIAAFFGALDERIALTADKVKLLKDQKTGYLQKIFAREMVFTNDNGERYPEWEQKKLIEVAAVTSGKRLPKGHQFAPSGTPYITVSDMGDKRVDQTNFSFIAPETERILERYKVVKGDVIISIAGTLGKVNLISEDLQNANLTENCDKIRVNEGIIPEFIYYVLKSPSIQGEIERDSTTSSQPKLALERLRNFSISLPSLPEQHKITEFFSVLDEQIELTENKLTLLKEQKKGYLQGIFG